MKLWFVLAKLFWPLQYIKSFWVLKVLINAKKHTSKAEHQIWKFQHFSKWAFLPPPPTSEFLIGGQRRRRNQWIASTQSCSFHPNGKNDFAAEAPPILSVCDITGHVKKIVGLLLQCHDAAFCTLLPLFTHGYHWDQCKRAMCKNVGLQTHNYWSPLAVAILSNSHAELWTFPSLHSFTRPFKTKPITLTFFFLKKRHWQRFSRVLYTLCAFTDLAKSLPWAWPHKATRNSMQMPEIGCFILPFCNSNISGWQLHSLTGRLRRPPCLLINRARIIFFIVPLRTQQEENLYFRCKTHF